MRRAEALGSGSPSRIRRRVGLLGVLVGWGLLACTAPSPESPLADAEPLLADETHTEAPISNSSVAVEDLFVVDEQRPLRPGESHAYRIELAAGEALHLVVEQLAIDLAIDVFDGAGNFQFTVDGPSGPFGPEMLALVASEAHSLRLEIRPLESATSAGSYRLQQRSVAPATDEDRMRAEAFEWHRLADLERLAGDIEGASSFYSQALDGWREVDEHRLAARALRRLGQMRRRTDFAGARGYFFEATALFNDLDKGWEWVGLMNELGSVQRRLGDMVGARASFREADRVGVVSGYLNGRTTALNNLGPIAQAAGNSEEALELYQLAHDLFAAQGKEASALQAKQNWAIALVALGRLDEAEVTLRQLLPQWQELELRGPEAGALAALGWVASLRDEHATAIQLYDRSLALETQVLETETLMQRGVSQEQLEAGGQAEEDYRAALQRLQKVGDRLAEAYARQHLGRLLLTRGSGTSLEGEQQLAKASGLFDEMGDDRGLADVDWIRAQWHRDHGRLTEARQAMEASLERLKSLRARLLSPSFRRTVQASGLPETDLYIDLLIEMHSTDPQAGFDRLAFEAAEAQRSRGLLEEMEADTGWRRRADPKLRLAQQQALDTLRLQESVRIAIASQRPDDPRLPALEANIDRQLVEQAEWQAKLRRSAGLEAQTQTEGVHLATIQDELRRSAPTGGVTLVAFHISSRVDYSVAWTLGSESLTMHPVDLDRATLNRFVDSILEAMEQGRGQGPIAAQAQTEIQALSRRLLTPPLLQTLQGARLLVVPDGAQALLPSSVLDLPTDSARGGAKLGEKFDLVHLPSTAVWLQLRQRGRDRHRQAESARSEGSKEREPIAIFAAGLYPRRAAPRLRPQPQPQDQTWRGSETYRFEPLPGSRAEAEAILRLFHQQHERARPLVLLGEDASRRMALEAPLADYRILHFATHGLIEAERPELSAIVLSLEDAEGWPMDGFLRLTDLEQLDLRADLVVLSACRTAGGQQIRGEGVFGLGQALFRAGAQALVVSHWQVSDRATAQLMSYFYAELLAGKAPAAALRVAQEAMRRDERWRHPVYWAAFSVQGEAFEPLF